MSLGTAPLRMAIFDCDGILVDSETIASRVIADEMTTLGWAMKQEEAGAHFLGMAMSDMLPMIVARVGSLPTGWVSRVANRIVNALAIEVTVMPGIESVLQEVTAMGLPWRVASNSSRAEMLAKFAATGLDRLIGDRLHSAYDVPRPKPAPDVFLAAAAAGEVAPASCAVIEDSIIGVRGAVAAGMTVFAFVPRDDDAPFREIGAIPVRKLAQLPGLLRLGMGASA